MITKRNKLGQIVGEGSRIKTKCKNCSKIFITYPSRVKIGKGQFCSIKCYREWMAKKHTIEMSCLNCGKKWKHPKSQLGYRFCSKECYRKFLKKSELEIYITRICPQCKKEFAVPTSRFRAGKKGIYCSKKCYTESMKLPEEILRKNRNARVRKYRREHPEWTAECKHRRRAREKEFGGHFTAKQWKELKKKHNYTCVICGEKEPKIKLTIDHKVSIPKWENWLKKHPRIKYGWNDIENIQPLCMSCNSHKSIKL